MNGGFPTTKSASGHSALRRLTYRSTVTRPFHPVHPRQSPDVSSSSCRPSASSAGRFVDHVLYAVPREHCVSAFDVPEVLEALARRHLRDRACGSAIGGSRSTAPFRRSPPRASSPRFPRNWCGSTVRPFVLELASAYHPVLLSVVPAPRLRAVSGARALRRGSCLEPQAGSSTRDRRTASAGTSRSSPMRLLPLALRRPGQCRRLHLLPFLAQRLDHRRQHEPLHIRARREVRAERMPLARDRARAPAAYRRWPAPLAANRIVPPLAAARFDPCSTAAPRGSLKSLPLKLRRSVRQRSARNRRRPSPRHSSPTMRHELRRVAFRLVEQSTKAALRNQLHVFREDREQATAQETRRPISGSWPAASSALAIFCEPFGDLARDPRRLPRGIECHRIDPQPFSGDPESLCHAARRAGCGATADPETACTSPLID